MKTFKLNEFTKGWFVGNFTPTIVDTKDFEVAVKEYKKGDAEESHYHKIAEEITVIVSGRVKMNDQIFEKGDIVQVAPGESAKFEALEDTTNVVIKIPSVKGDKYLMS
ncbi:MAG: hypothetical protein G01um10145_897 [Microgenomates group bacterium Gr01-1014_5]|nr:MAG: hypothetical protein G01um10145_897 [Microgenomates group bacterium Gr01-1014_5]